MDTNESSTTSDDPSPAKTETADFDILSGYGTDPQAEQDGVWSNEFMGGIEVRLRSSQSKEVKAALKRQTKRIERFQKTGADVPDAVVLKNQVDLASAATADWRRRFKPKGAEADTVTATIPFGGQSLACTDENKQLVYKHPKLWSFRMDVVNQMFEIARFRAAALEADAGN